MNAHFTRARSALVVDDDIVTRAVIADALDEMGLAVREAGDGAEALAACAEALPDVILLDVSMPGMSGFEVCRALRDDRRTCHLPVLMLTGLDDQDSVETAFAAGATDFSTKPCNLPLLRHRVRYLLRAKEIADQLRHSEAGLARAQALARLGGFELERDGERLLPSPQARRMLFGGDDSAPLTLDDLLAGVGELERARVAAALRGALADGRALALDFEFQRGDERRIAVHLELEPLDLDGVDGARRMGTLQDLSQQRAAEQRIRELAFFDGVTGLPNRAFFMERLNETLAAARRHARQFAVMFIDLDQFKRVNDTLGHAAGDDLLREVARRINCGLRRTDAVTRGAELQQETVARLGGDEFVVLLSDIRRPEDAALVARRILDQLTPPVPLGDTEVKVSGSIGIASYPGDGLDEASLLKCADMAMYRVKTDGRNGYRFYTPALNTRVVERLTLEASLKRALERDEFELHYQPQLSIAGTRVIGVEALLRWRHPDVGLVRPADFIPIAEETGLIGPLSLWVLERACDDARRWREARGWHLRVAVNLSPTQLRDPGLAAGLAGLLSRHGLEPGMLELELTENMVSGSDSGAQALLGEIHALGVRFALDDFGTGHLSLSQLRQVPLSTFKLAPDFVRDLPRATVDMAIVKSTLTLAHNLHATVIAESVENAEQCACLEKLGCDAMQGYHVSPPLPWPELMSWLEEHRLGAAQTPGPASAACL